ncbi:MAG: hypothetical protein ACREI9_04605 [Nitrospiraceae bacterium]
MVYTGGLGAAKYSEAQAKQAVQQVFLEILEREPNYPGVQGYVDCLLERENKKNFGPGSCNVDDLRTMVLQSQEYRDLQARKAAAVYGAPAESGMVTTSGLPFLPGAEGGIMSMSVGGIPLPILAGGLVLLMLLKKK